MNSFAKRTIIVVAVLLFAVLCILAVSFNKEINRAYSDSVSSNLYLDGHVNMFSSLADLTSAKVKIESLEIWLENNKKTVVELEGQEKYEERLQKVQAYKARIEELRSKADALSKELYEEQKK